MDDFEPKSKRWYVAKQDFGRRVAIVQTLEDAKGQFRILVPTPVGPIQYAYNVLVGNEPMEALHTPAEAQELMDALWQAGLRPSRR